MLTDLGIVVSLNPGKSIAWCQQYVNTAIDLKALEANYGYHEIIQMLSQLELGAGGVQAVNDWKEGLI